MLGNYDCAATPPKSSDVFCNKLFAKGTKRGGNHGGHSGHIGCIHFAKDAQRASGHGNHILVAKEATQEYATAATSPSRRT
jgi:hypothetical protein